MNNSTLFICKRVAALVAAFLLITACAPRERTLDALGRLSVSWELLENRFEPPERCRAAFTFVNTGRPLSGEGWQLCFNQATVRPAPPADSSLGWVEHINGDFYRFTPGAEFFLATGDTLRFEYAYRGVMIKESDAPAGVYFSVAGGVLSVENFTVKPFDDHERLFPGFNHLIPTPQSEFVKNSAFHALPDQEIGLVIPTPVRCTAGDRIDFTPTVIVYQEGLENEADYLINAFAAQFGIRLAESQNPANSAIVLKTAALTVNGVDREAYHLRVTPNQAVISGSDPAGVFYGIVTLLGLVPAERFGVTAAFVSLPVVEIFDAPRFCFRGFLLDAARNFQQKEAVLKLIDLLAFYKINTLNLRLTDDEGWRLEIDGLPELTRVGGRRGHTLDDAEFLPPSFGSGPFPDAEGNLGSGHFTRQDFREILCHAAQRHIRVAPEICFPSHARAAIKAMEARYRYFTAKGDPQAANEFRLIDPDDRSIYSSAQLYTDNIADVALASTYHFYQTVVRDIAAMYREAGVELSLFHTGGDEVPRGAWTQSPACRKLLAAHPEIGGPRGLQAYFFARMLDSLAAPFQIGGWEEVVLSKDDFNRVSVNQQFLDRNVVAYVWDNTGGNLDLGYRIANAGYPVVLCNVTNLYFDLAYNTDPREPGLYWGGFQDAKDPYVLMPFDVFKSAVYDEFGLAAEREEDHSSKERLKPESRKNILGLQAQLWSETVKGREMMEYYLLPKLFAFAERAWAAAPAWENEPDLQRRTRLIDDDWNEFANRIGRCELPRLDRLFGGWNYRIPPPGAVIKDGVLIANIGYPGLTIRFTTDGSEPTVDSPLYTVPVRVDAPVKLAAFSNLGKRGWVAEVE